MTNLNESFLTLGSFSNHQCFKILGFAKNFAKYCAKVDKMNHNIFNTLIYKLFSVKGIFFLDTQKKKDFINL